MILALFLRENSLSIVRTSFLLSDIQPLANKDTPMVTVKQQARVKRNSKYSVIGTAKTVCIILMRTSDKKILTLQQNSDKQWYEPGGRILDGESLDAAARRTLLRDTGIDIDTCTIRGKLWSGWCRAQVRFYTVDGDIKVVPGGSVNGYEWRDPRGLTSVPNTKRRHWAEAGAIAHFRLCQSLKLTKHLLDDHNDEPKFNL